MLGVALAPFSLRSPTHPAMFCLLVQTDSFNFRRLEAAVQERHPGWRLGALAFWADGTSLLQSGQDGLHPVIMECANVDKPHRNRRGHAQVVAIFDTLADEVYSRPPGHFNQGECQSAECSMIRAGVCGGPPFYVVLDHDSRIPHPPLGTRAY